MKPKAKAKPRRAKRPSRSPSEQAFFSRTDAALLLLLDRTAAIEKTVTVLLTKVNKIMATMAELQADLEAVTSQVEKIGTETSACLEKITALEDALAASGGTTPEVDAAMAALKAQVQVVDDLVQDPTKSA